MDVPVSPRIGYEIYKRKEKKSNCKNARVVEDAGVGGKGKGYRVRLSHDLR